MWGWTPNWRAVARPQALGLGEHYTQSAQVTIPRSASGPYYLIVVADSTSTIFEFAAENNNISPSPAQMFVTLAAPADLSVTNVVVTPATGLPDGRGACLLDGAEPFDQRRAGAVDRHGLFIHQHHLGLHGRLARTPWTTRAAWPPWVPTVRPSMRSCPR